MIYANCNSLLVFFFVSCLHVCIQAAKVDTTSFYIFVEYICYTLRKKNLEYLKKKNNITI